MKKRLLVLNIAESSDMDELLGQYVFATLVNILLKTDE